jgi:hypothetical protein
MSNEATPPPPAPAPGWYDDGSGAKRWWDGVQWSTQYVAPTASPVQRFSGVAITGFVLALVAAVCTYVVGAGVILGLFGIVFSCVGISATAQMRGRGLAVAGLIIAALALIAAVSHLAGGI